MAIIYHTEPDGYYDIRERVIVVASDCLGETKHKLDERYPEITHLYKQYCRNHNPQDIWGRILALSTENKSSYIIYGFCLKPASKSTQVRTGSYDALDKVLYAVVSFCKNHNIKTIGIPLHFTSEGNTNWEIVKSIITEQFRNSNIDIHFYFL